MLLPSAVTSSPAPDGKARRLASMLTTYGFCRNTHAQQHNHCTGRAAAAGSDARAGALAHCRECTDAQRLAEGSTAWLCADCAALLQRTLPQKLAVASSSFDPP